MAGTPSNSINVSSPGIVGFNGTVFNSSTVIYHSLLIGGSTSSSIINLGVATNGQIPIGSTGARPVLATLTQGENITITNGPGSVTVSCATTSIVRQVFTYNAGLAASYTPTSGMVYCDVEVVGGGGGGGGSFGSPSTIWVSTGGGGGGGYARKIFSAAQIGSATIVNIGAGGSGGAAGNNDGSAGGRTSLGAGPTYLLYATGGFGGNGSTIFENCSTSLGGVGGSGFLGNFNTTGEPGGCSLLAINTDQSASIGVSSGGGSTFFGGGARALYSGAGGNGAAGSSYGGGGGGALVNIEQGAASGGNGAPGVCIITEYCKI